MFKKILIANRGEIACRVIKSAHAMGIKTVAVYSDADATALHVEMADEAVHLGPPPAGQSYLLIDKIIAACQQTGAEAVHPGYGFLSERTAFAEALEKAGITFIGPPKGAIAAMGDKIESKKLAAKANVSTVPGHIGEIDDAEEAVKIAQDIGFPVMIKASAGGGGKGMRIAHNDQEVREGYAGARNEARSSFGDDRVFIEKFVVEPRHIEIQVLGDKHGNILYLGERECSIQRRHQKVVEEAPSPFVDPAMRKAMGEQAVALARAVDYHSAGTVEFIVGADKSFYFLEMNTRLQVEHPITEQVTGVDLVEQMIRVAAGEKLPFSQDDIKLTGWAVENRVYAEDPYRNFLPSIGRLVRYRQPEGERVRVDTGVVEGSEISMFYDPMIAKLVTWGDTREEAIDRQLEALDRYYIRGISHNIHFLSAVMAHPRFREGRLTTGFIAEEYPDGFAGAAMAEGLRERLIAVAAVVNIMERSRESEISGQLDGPPSARTEWIVELDKQRHPIALDADGEDLLVKIEGQQALTVESDWLPGMPVFEGLVGGEPVVVEIDRDNLGLRLSTRGATHKAVVYDPHAAAMAAHMIEKVPPDTTKLLLCPMPGQVVRVEVAVGEKVEPGQPLAIVEAMKMENILRAERQAVVKAINAEPGTNLPVDAVIMEFE